MSRLKVAVSADDHVQGDDQALVTLLEYGDYECPHCGYAYPIVKRVQEHFGRKLRFVFRNFPLRNMHPNAEAAAEAAEFAGAHGRFWEMHDAIFENQPTLSLPMLLEVASALELDPEGLNRAFTTGEFRSRVQTDFQGGVRSGVNGTPTFFIDGERHDGSFEFEDLIAALESKLAESS